VIGLWENLLVVVGGGVLVAFILSAARSLFGRRKAVTLSVEGDIVGFVQTGTVPVPDERAASHRKFLWLLLSLRFHVVASGADVTSFFVSELQLDGVSVKLPGGFCATDVASPGSGVTVDVDLNDLALDMDQRTLGPAPRNGYLGLSYFVKGRPEKTGFSDVAFVIPGMNEVDTGWSLLPTQAREMDPLRIR